MQKNAIFFSCQTSFLCDKTATGRRRRKRRRATSSICLITIARYFDNLQLIQVQKKIDAKSSQFDSHCRSDASAHYLALIDDDGDEADITY